MEQRLTARQLQAWTNFTYALRWHGLAEHFQFGAPGTNIGQDRLITPCDSTLEAALDASPYFSRDAVFLKSCHPGAYASFRENQTLDAMQITLVFVDGQRKADVDCDRGRPFYDLVGWLVHAAECLIQGKTNPHPVRRAWNRRGMGIPKVPVMNEEQVSA